MFDLFKYFLSQAIKIAIISRTSFVPKNKMCYQEPISISQRFRKNLVPILQNHKPALIILGYSFFCDLRRTYMLINPSSLVVIINFDPYIDWIRQSFLFQKNCFFYLKVVLTTRINVNAHFKAQLLKRARMLEYKFRPRTL